MIEQTIAIAMKTMTGMGSPRIVPLPMKASWVVVMAGPPVITKERPV